MNKTCFTEHQILSILQEQEKGLKAFDTCWVQEISQGRFYNWKAKTYRNKQIQPL